VRRFLLGNRTATTGLDFDWLLVVYLLEKSDHGPARLGVLRSVRIRNSNRRAPSGAASDIIAGCGGAS